MGYSSLLVCLCVTCESTHLDAIALRLQPPNNKLLVLNVADFDVTASLSYKSEQKLSSLNLHVGTRPLFEVPYVFTAEVIPYKEQWKRVTTIES